MYTIFVDYTNRVCDCVETLASARSFILQHAQRSPCAFIAYSEPGGHWRPVAVWRYGKLEEPDLHSPRG